MQPRPMGQSMYGESSRYHVDDDYVSMKMKMSSMDYGRQDVCDETMSFRLIQSKCFCKGEMTGCRPRSLLIAV